MAAIRAPAKISEQLGPTLTLSRRNNGNIGDLKNECEFNSELDFEVVH